MPELIFENPEEEARLKKEYANMREFLKELSILTRKYEIVLSSCGCCGSIRANKLSARDKDAEKRYDALIEISPYTTNKVSAYALSWRLPEEEEKEETKIK